MNAQAPKSGLLAKLRCHWKWANGYNGTVFSGDLTAAIVVTILLVPQSLAYAVLAGLPPQYGIYASVFPLIAYALFGSSRQLAVGPTAIISLLTATAIAVMPEAARPLSAAALALMVGVILMVLGLLKAGIVMNFVSRPVVSAYVSGSAILIMISQMKHILGLSTDGSTAFSMAASLIKNLSQSHLPTVLIGFLAMIFLVLCKDWLALLLVKAGMRAKRAKIIARMAPIVAVIASVIIVTMAGLVDNHGIRTVGHIPDGLPFFSLPLMDRGDYETLAGFACVIALVAFVDSTSIAQTFAARTRARIDADKELLGLGASNFVAGLSGAYPVTGSFSRSAVNLNAGAQTPVAGILTAGFMALTALFFTPLLWNLPLAVLAAMIIVACFSLIDLRTLWKTYQYSPDDGITAILTFLSVLAFGVQWGVMVGVVLAMALHIRKTLRPHMALVGRFPGTEHYRDAERFNVETDDYVKTLRIDESLYYANARYLEDKIARIAAEYPKMTDLILMCPAVNYIDASALSSLSEINKRLKSIGVRLHFSELHSKVSQRLRNSDFLHQLTGDVFLSQHEAMEALEPEPDWSQFSDHMDLH